LEPGDPRPQPHVAGWRVLCLEPADLLDGFDEPDLRPLQQQLPFEE
jgi:hypothetical protein